MTSRQFRLLCAATALALACACGTSTSGQATDAGAIDAGPDCGANPCLCCLPSQRCVDGKSCCTPDCDGKECGDDGCGGQCGDCAALHDAFWSCDPTTFRCTCSPESDLNLCAAHDQTCGTLTAADRCGNTHTDVDCTARCVAPNSCHVDGTCRCDAEDAAALCSRFNRTCGDLTVDDNCATSRTVQCGSCPADKSCDATGACVCLPDSDAALCTQAARACGALAVTDNCGANRAIASCGACATGEVCTPAGQCLLCTPESDADFCSRQAAYCDAITGVDNCGLPRSVSCGTCTAPATCQANNACGNGVAPTNDTCSQPALIPLSANPAGGLIGSVHADTALATDDIFSNCDLSSTGRDVVFKFFVPPGPNVNAQLAVTPSPGSSLAAVPSLRRQCDAQTTEFACAYSTSTTATVAVASRNLAPGEYFVWIDGWLPYTNGPFDLTLSLTPVASAPANDACATAQPLALVNGAAAVVADNTAAVNDYAGACAATNGGDLAYSFTLSAPSAVTATVTRDVGSPALQPAVYIRSSCASAAAADQVACAVAKNGVATARAAYLAAGTYFVLVDSTDGTWGTFKLELAATAPLAGDTCSNPIPLPIDPVSGVGSINGDTTRALDDLASSCLGAAGGNDLVYQITVPGSAAVRADLEVIPNGTALAPAVSLHSSCGAQASELGCAASTSTAVSARLTVSRLAPGTYFILVDGNGAAASGAFALNVALGVPPPAPANDSCAQPQTLTFDATGLATATGTTVGANDDSRGGCATAALPHYGGDVVYAFTLTSTRNVAVSVAPSGLVPFRSAVYLRASCGDVATERACANLSNGAASATAANLAAGTYYVIVDGIGGTEGDFTLTVAAYGAIANDACASAATLAFDANGDATVVGDTTLATSDGASAASGACAGVGSGGDLLYTFTLSRPTNVTISDTPIGSGLRPVLYLRRTTCSSAASADELSCSDPGYAGGGAVLDIRNLAAGTYWVWADSFGGFPGPFALHVHLGSPQTLAANDQCGGAIALVPDANGLATVTGDLDTATGGSDGSCAPGSGVDLVYTLTLAQPKGVQFTVQPTTRALKPALYVNTICGGDSATEKGCSANAVYGSPAMLNIPVLGAGTYYVVVDSLTLNGGGPFTLTAQLTAAPPPPANDVCTGATPLAWSGTAAAASGDTSYGSDDERSSCLAGTSPLNGPDLVYSFELTAAARVTATVTRTLGNAVYRPAVSIRSSCAVADEVACARDASGGSTVSVSLDPGTYYVVVDGVGSAVSGSANGPFTLQLVRTSAIPDDGCGNPGTIGLDPITGVGRVTGSLSSATNSGDGSCSTGSGADLVYALTLPSEKTVQVALANDSGSTSLYPNVYLRRACSDAASELACAAQPNANNAASFTLNRLAAGTYFVWVDTTSASYQGAFALTVATSTPAQPLPGNDACGAAQPLVIDGANGGAQVLGDSSYALQDYAGSCGTASAPLNGPDLVYSFTLAQSATLFASVARAPGAPANFAPALYLRTACADAASEVACASTAGAAAASLRQLLQPGTYYLFVDGQQGTGGPFVLNAAALASTAMTNEGCATAKELTFDASGVAVAAGSATGMANDATGSCYSSSTASDAAYKFTLTGSRRVTVDLNPVGANMYPMVYVQTSCGTPSSERGCAYTWAFGGAELKLGTLAAGTYYLFADSPSAYYSGAFVLAVRAEPPPPPPANDLCRGAQLIAIDPATGKGSVTGDTLDAVDDYVSFCSIGQTVLGGQDLVYSFNLAAAASVTAKVTRDAANTVFRPAVGIRAGCAQSDELACATDKNGVSTVTATLAAGLYYVFVDGVSSATPGSGSGPFTLEISTGAPVPGDSCGSALPLAIDPGTGIGTVAGDLASASNSGDGSCAANSGSDLVYSFTLAQAKAVRVTLANPSGVIVLHPAVHLRRTCADPREELGCAASSSSAAATFYVPRLAPGTYYVWADASSGSAQGSYVLTVETTDPTSAPPANDTCAAPQALALDAVNNAAHVSGDTSGASSDYAGTCAMTSSFPLSGGDLVYAITLPQAATLYAVVNKDPAESRTFFPAVYLRSACESTAPADELACGSTGNNLAASFVKALAAGTYYLIVDGQNGSAGRFLLDLAARSTSTMTNENCASVQPLALDTSGLAIVAGSTAGLNSDAIGSCNSISTAPDVVYSLTTTGTKNISVDLMGGAGFNSMVYVRTSCTDSATQIACDYRTTYGVPIHIDLVRRPAGTYYVWVDGYTTYSGLFALEVRAVDPPAPPANDTCAGAQPLTLPPPGAAPLQVAATTLNSSNDLTGSCATASAPFDGPDNVYAFTTTSTVMVTAKVTPTSLNLKPAVYIRSACATAGLDRCAYSTNAGPLNAASVTAVLPAGTWYLIVDGVAATAGDYLLEITTTSYLGVGATVTPLVTFATWTNVYGMATDASEVFFDHTASSVGAVAKSGGTPYFKGSADGLTPETLGFDIVEANGSIFSLDNSTSNTSGRLWKIKDAVSGWLSVPVRWDVPAGVTMSSWPTTETYALTTDGANLIIAGGGTTSTAPVAFYAVSAAAPELPRLIGTGSVVYYARGIAADQSYFYVAGTSMSGSGVWRFDQLNLGAAPVKLVSASGHSATLTAVRVDSLTAPRYLYARPYANGSAIHVVANPAGAAPSDLGPIALPGIESSNTNVGMTYDRAGGALYYFENATDSNGVIWKVQ